jgi:hypothetical protein
MILQIRLLHMLVFMVNHHSIIVVAVAFVVGGCEGALDKDGVRCM